MIKRGVIQQIEPFLTTDDVILLYGARQVGKTSIMKYLQTEYFPDNSLFFDLEEEEHLKIFSQKSQEKFIEYLKAFHDRTPDQKMTIFIDEVQYLDNPTGFLKYLHDHYEHLKFIVSGSSTLEIRNKMKDSMVGRLMRFDIFPLSFEEFLVFRGKENLVKFIGAGVALSSVNQSIIDEDLKMLYEEFITFGAYPKVILSHNILEKKAYLKQIFETYIQKDIKDIGKIREVEHFNTLVKMLAEQAGNLVNITELSNKLGSSINTIKERLLLLENTFVIKFVYPFSGNIRGELTKMPKVFFIDNGLRNAIYENYEITGNSFENTFFAHINNAYKAKSINFYRTKDKQEIDFVLDGKPYELKESYTGKNLTALNAFHEKYQQKGTVITLNKRENPKYDVAFPREV